MADFLVLKGGTGILKIIILMFELIAVSLVADALQPKFQSIEIVEIFYLVHTVIVVIFAMLCITFFIFFGSPRSMLHREWWRNMHGGFVTSGLLIYYVVQINDKNDKKVEGECPYSAKYLQRMIPACIFGGIAGTLHFVVAGFIYRQIRQLPDEIHVQELWCPAAGNPTPVNPLVNPDPVASG